MEIIAIKNKKALRFYYCPVAGEIYVQEKINNLFVGVGAQKCLSEQEFEKAVKKLKDTKGVRIL